MFEDSYPDGKEALHSGSECRPGGEEKSIEMFNIKV
jgi:hypothetical protein